jgi:hypothetical protein
MPRTAKETIMSVFTTTTKRKITGLIMALPAVAALIATITFAIAGEFQYAIPTTSMFINLTIIMLYIAARMEKKDEMAKRDARRRAYWD